MPQQVTTKIISQKELKPGCFRMKLEAPAIARRARPGQFLHLRCGESTDPLLRRPISMHRIGKREVEILYHAAGKGTEILSRKKKGDSVDTIGPLGNGFKIYKNTPSVKMLVAGGMGVAPLLAVAEGLSAGAGKRQKYIVVLGARTQNRILCEKEFENLGGEIHIATEDGSRGKRGLATELAEEIIRSKKYIRQEICIYAAGPIDMVKALCRLMEGCSLESQVSLEQRMGCALGACLGCVIDTQTGYKRVCKDGPVFNMCEVLCG